MWTPEHRQAAARRGLRYPSDLTDAEWALIEPMIPPARRGGRPRDVNVREVLNGIFYVRTGCQWRRCPRTCRRVDGARRRPPRALCGLGGGDRPERGSAKRLRSTRRAAEGHGAQAPHPRRYTRPVVESSIRRRRDGARELLRRAPFVPLQDHPPTAATSRAATVATTAAGKIRTSAPLRRRNAGSWSERSPGSAAGASPATSVMPEPLSPSSVSP